MKIFGLIFLLHFIVIFLELLFTQSKSKQNFVQICFSFENEKNVKLVLNIFKGNFLLHFIVIFLELLFTQSKSKQNFVQICFSFENEKNVKLVLNIF